MRGGDGHVEPAIPAINTEWLQADPELKEKRCKKLKRKYIVVFFNLKPIKLMIHESLSKMSKTVIKNQTKVIC